MKQRLTQYIGIDKIVHFLGCYFIASTGVYIFDSLLVSVIIALIIGIGIEIFDSSEKNNIFSWRDIIADVAGVAVLALQIWFNQIVY